MLYLHSYLQGREEIRTQRERKKIRQDAVKFYLILLLVLLMLLRTT